MTITNLTHAETQAIMRRLADHIIVNVNAAVSDHADALSSDDRIDAIKVQLDELAAVARTRFETQTLTAAA